jgi:hypothetical protein
LFFSSHLAAIERRDALERQGIGILASGAKSNSRKEGSFERESRRRRRRPSSSKNALPFSFAVYLRRSSAPFRGGAQTSLSLSLRQQKGESASCREETYLVFAPF